eukprot:3770023-Amphidinium_carterae.1
MSCLRPNRKRKDRTNNLAFALFFCSHVLMTSTVRCSKRACFEESFAHRTIWSQAHNSDVLTVSCTMIASANFKASNREVPWEGAIHATVAYSPLAKRTETNVSKSMEIGWHSHVNTGW